MGVLVVNSTRGGLNDTDPPITLADDQCTVATNVEWRTTTLGERRTGGVAIEQPGSWPFTGCERCVFLHRHLPSTEHRDAQLWALCINDTGPAAVLAYKDTTWHVVTMPDALVIDGQSEYRIDVVSLHGKLFLFYPSGEDVLHVWEEGDTALRRVGLAAVAVAPTGADTAGAGTFVTTRYYRTREIVSDGTDILLRSEPSPQLAFTPVGNKDGVTVTKPATVNSSATHWELEASLDDANYYRIAVTAIGTTTATDNTSAATGYQASGFTLSETIGDYTQPHSARYGIADEDRLVIFGSFEDEDLDSSMSWTPVFNAPGVGNDERIRLDPVSNLNLDGFEGGPIVDVWSAVLGEIWVFKDGHIYKCVRTGISTRAYEPITMTKKSGTVRGSVIEGIDESGNPALYFADPAVGPRRAGRGGIQRCGRDVWSTWQDVNLDAAKVTCDALYYPTTQQVQWRFATGSGDVPDTGLVLHTNEQRQDVNGELRRGYAKWTGPSMGALTSCLFSDNIDDDTDRSNVLVPFIGVEGQGLIWRLDTGDDDNGTEYAAQLTTKPFAPTQLETNCEVRNATLIAAAVDDAHVVVSAIPDFGISTTKTSDTIDLSPKGDELHVVRKIDDIGIAELTTVQFDISDPATPGARWELARLSATITPGQGA